ncbi:hypothetical protein ATANTOWER_020544 [Ataeniobius toweri]|uniref:Uncharacterized protein n=1 Tax=Ataeniobius toweri TaxID=208326 RepID=A0ABU7BAB0_9TELE|nr:hypothetical protein [Ataeniobius toweri]
MATVFTRLQKNGELIKKKLKCLVPLSLCIKRFKETHNSLSARVFTPLKLHNLPHYNHKLQLILQRQYVMDQLKVVHNWEDDEWFLEISGKCDIHFNSSPLSQNFWNHILLQLTAAGVSLCSFAHFYPMDLQKSSSFF